MPRFTDKPKRRAGMLGSALFAAHAGFYAGDDWLGAPNAVLTGQAPGGAPVTLVLTLYSPAFSAANASLTYKVQSARPSIKAPGCRCLSGRVGGHLAGLHLAESSQGVAGQPHIQGVERACSHSSVRLSLHIRGSIGGPCSGVRSVTACFTERVDHPQVTLIPAAPEISAASVDAGAPRALQVQGASLFIDPWCAQPRPP